MSLGVGQWVETNIVPSTFDFVADFSPATSGGPPSDGFRAYWLTVHDL